MSQLFDPIAHACKADILLVAILPHVFHQLICLVIVEHNNVLSHQLEAHPLKIIEPYFPTQKLTHCILIYQQFLQYRLVCNLVAFLSQEWQMLVNFR